MLPLVSLLAWLFVGCDAGAPKTSTPTATKYPTKALTVICPWAAGGGTDRVTRFMADQLQKHFGQPAVVVNKTGGSGAVGHSAGALARPDGYTLTMATFELSTMHWMGISELTWKNFEPLLQVNADSAALIVRKDAPWQTLSDFLADLKKSPGRLKMSGTATGGAWDLARAGFLQAAGLPLNSVLWVPAQGSAPALVELLGGHIDLVCCSVPEAASQLEAGELRVLTVMAPQRLAEFPHLKTAREDGVPWDAVGWRGLVLPKNTPAEIVNALTDATRKITESDEFKTFMKKNGFAVAVRGPTEFATYLEAQDAQWQKVIAAAGYAKP